MKALILAAGYATRLYPLTKEQPKPLLEVKDKPIISYILDKLSRLREIDEVFVITNSKFFAHFLKWQKGLKIKKPVRIIDDRTCDNAGRLGAVGDISFALEGQNIKDDLLVAGGDNLFDGSLSGFLAFARRKKNQPVVGVFDIRDRSEAKKYGIVKLGRGGRVVDFQEKPKRPFSTLAAMCLYYFPKDTLGLVRQYLEHKNKNSDASGSYIGWLSKMGPVYGFQFSGSWYDIGDIKFYKEAQLKFRGKIIKGEGDA